MFETTAVTVVIVGITATTVFLMTPFSNVLNLITVPLGYEYSSCPYCPEFGVKKIEYEECDNCGEEHATNFGASWYTGGQDGEKYHFCQNECLREFKSEVNGDAC